MLSEREIIIDEDGNDKYVAVTENFVYIVTMGLMTGSLGGGKIKAHAIDSISAVDVSTGLIYGKFELTIPGQLGDTSSWNSGIFSDIMGEGVILFNKSKLDTFEKIAQKIRELKVKKKENPVIMNAPSLDIPEQIKKLAELKNAGILTEEEFQKKKDELLKRL